MGFILVAIRRFDIFATVRSTFVRCHRIHGQLRQKLRGGKPLFAAAVFLTKGGPSPQGEALRTTTKRTRSEGVPGTNRDGQNC